MGKLTEILRPSGTVKWQIIRRDGNIDYSSPEKNLISAELKNKLADTLHQSTANFGVMTSPFANNDFSIPTNGDSGIVIATVGPSLKFEMLTTLKTTSALSFTIEGLVRAEASYEVDYAMLGFDWYNLSFNTDYSSYDFSPNLDLVNGDQLNITWQITMSDN